VKHKIPGKIIYFAVALISVLLIVNNVLTFYNNRIIEKNKALQYEAAQLHIYYDEIGKTVIHSLDLGLRGYAIIPKKQFAKPFYDAILAKDSILEKVAMSLQNLGYPQTNFQVLTDSVNAYANYIAELKLLLDSNELDSFQKKFETDRGMQVWQLYIDLEKQIFAFVSNIESKARSNYQTALIRNQVLQLLILIISLPTLFYMASFAIKNFRLSEKLRSIEEENNRMLKGQNQLLEQRVHARTQEILIQNGEIKEQREALTIQNKQLFEAQKTIELQHREIQQMNVQLKTDVTVRTQELREANKQLLEQNNQLEQFAFIAAHNLRAPLTRILGLANLMRISHSEGDRTMAIEKIVTSTEDLDVVVGDLNTVLNIRRHSENLTEIDLESVLDRVKRTLEREISLTHAVITSDFSNEGKIFAVAAYAESIIYNLVSNAIKYRHPSRIPFIILRTEADDDAIVLTISDNGLGIDLGQYGHQVFNLYKRFHLHMEGKGLGLYLVKTQVESMGGKIELSSKPDEGSIFTVTFRRPFVNA
jgi:signal transduction histidine kinase